MSIQVQELVVYPIKSLRGVSLATTQLEKRGLRHDRRWMLVDREGLFLTQRKLHRMALFNTAITPDGLRVEVAGKAPVDIPLEPQGGPRQVQVWQSVCEALEVSRDVSVWFTDALEVECSLVYMPETTERLASSSEEENEYLVGFADGNPVLVAGEASLRDLNDKLEKPIPIRRFRPNVVLSGSASFEEDDWTQIQIGDVELTRRNRCGRCLVTTIDIDTATPSDEPLRTLNGYRKFGNSVCFGTYYAPDTFGQISVGDVVTTSLG